MLKVIVSRVWCASVCIQCHGRRDSHQIYIVLLTSFMQIYLLARFNFFAQKKKLNKVNVHNNGFNFTIWVHTFDKSNDLKSQLNNLKELHVFLIDIRPENR